MKPQSIKVTLGEKEYEIEPLPIKGAREVRHKFAAVLAPAVTALQGAPQTEMSDYSAIAGIISAVKDTLLGLTDLCLDLLFEYSPTLKTNRDEIEATAYDQQVISAFVEVLKLLYPFVQALAGMTGLASLPTGKK